MICCTGRPFERAPAACATGIAFCNRGLGLALHFCWRADSDAPLQLVAGHRFLPSPAYRAAIATRNGRQLGGTPVSAAACGARRDPGGTPPHSMRCGVRLLPVLPSPGEAIRTFSSSWFLVVMGTGIVAQLIGER